MGMTLLLFVKVMDLETMREVGNWKLPTLLRPKSQEFWGTSVLVMKTCKLEDTWEINKKLRLREGK